MKTKTSLAARLLEQMAQQGVPLALDALTGATKPNPPEPKPIRKLGVLFVHGIGNQRRGDTLTRFGEPLFTCLQRWFSHHNGGARLERVSLREDPMERRKPAHAIVRLWYEPEEAGKEQKGAKGQGEGEAEPQKGCSATWQFAESNWGDVFERPNFGSVAFWSIRVVPWLILTQFVDQLSDALQENRPGRVLFSFAYLVLTFPLALLIQMLVLLLVPMSLIPPLRPLVAPVQRWIASFIGDTYVLMTSRFQFQSMVGKVGEDLNWLADECEVVAVVAHSQGAAVAHEAVRQAKNPKVERLITFGSAVSRLKALRYVTEHARGMLSASSLITLSSLVLAGLYLWNLLRGGSIAYAVLGLWSLGILLALSAYLMPFTLKGINQVCHERQDFGLPDATKWEDYYATADPVPNGKMLPSSIYTAESREVHNRTNVLIDHSTYWRNLDEFASAVLQSLMTLTGGRFESQAWGFFNFYHAYERRSQHSRYRVGARVAAVIAASTALFPHPVLKSGFVVPEALRAPLGWTAAFINWLLLLAGDALGLVGSSLNLTGRHVALPRISLPVEVLSWPVACVSVALLWFGVSAVILRWWENMVTDDHFRSRWTWRSCYPRRAWWAVFGLLAAAWTALWVWWIVLSPTEVWTALAERLSPLWSTAGNASLYVPFIAYHIGKALYDAVQAQIELSHKLEKRFVGLGDLGFSSLRQTNAPTLWQVMGEGFSEMLERIGRRRVNGRVSAWVAALTALAAVALVWFDLGNRAVMQAALGLVALSCGVLGWVRAEHKDGRVASVLGLLVGVAVAPTAIAWDFGLTTDVGVGLVAAGIAAAICGFWGAESLRRGWMAVHP